MEAVTHEYRALERRVRLSHAAARRQMHREKPHVDPFEA
jgi:hypothetical protein